MPVSLSKYVITRLRPVASPATFTTKVVLAFALLACASWSTGQESVGTGEMMDHSHLPIAVPAGAPGPGLSLVLSRDAMTGFNLKIITRNFSMMPPPAGVTDMQRLMGATVDGNGLIEGHAHLYVNGVKVQRLYGHDVHLPATLFKPGVNQITVSINNHGHLYWTFDQRQILATLFIDPDAEDPLKHRFESFPVEPVRG